MNLRDAITALNSHVLAGTKPERDEMKRFLSLAAARAALPEISRQIDIEIDKLANELNLQTLTDGDE